MATINKIMRAFTREGARSKRFTPEMELRRALLNCLLWENQFYEDGVAIADRIKALVPLVAPERTAELAIAARETMKLRHAPLFVVREMARKSREVTAVFCCSDRYALMLMNACFAEGIRVPEDLSVMGFDDNALARLGRPQLTTVHQDAEYKGYLSAELLIGMIRGEQPEKKQVILRPELVIRGSVCEAPDKENGV